MIDYYINFLYLPNTFCLKISTIQKEITIKNATDEQLVFY